MGKMIIGADFVPTKSNENLFLTGNEVALIGSELVELLKGAEYRVFNLEMPITDKYQPIDKCGPAMRGNPKTIKIYNNLQINLFTLANNHIMDQSAEGLYDTISTLRNNNISYLGIGRDLEEANSPYIYKSANGKRIGFYACAEHEFSIAKINRPGANPYDPMESFDHVKNLSSKCDYVIVLYHGGKEFYRYPSPMLQKVCRKFIEKGANLVLTQHSHCIGCQEEYQGGVIVYGQGNFLFDGGDNEFWQTGLLTSVDTDTFVCEQIPVVKVDAKVRIANEQQREEILTKFIERSNQIRQPGFVSTEYNKFADEKIEGYLLSMCGIGARNVFFRIINKLSKHKYQKVFLKKKYGKNQCLALQNYIECEAHEELLIEGLKHFCNRSMRTVVFEESTCQEDCDESDCPVKEYIKTGRQA